MRVKEILKEKGMTAKELSCKIGMTETGLGIALSDKGNPPLKRLEQIALALDVPVRDLFDSPSKKSLICPQCGTELELTVKRN